ncbi:MAG: PAS domain S-box protein [Acidobacteriota bacterium]|nr:PAS domain S-box protein [Acidobacteriota bacterium]MDH3784386.1 PAS domain S-box protein [Acidobacteriota bacterium]
MELHPVNLGTLLPPLLREAPGATVLAAGLIVVVIFFVSMVLLLAWRRRQRDAVRVLVGQLEGLRDGEARQSRGDVEASFDVVQDAIDRLGRDLDDRRQQQAVDEDRDRNLLAAAETRSVVSTDLDGDVREFSSGAERLFGWSARDVIGRPAAVLFEDGSYKAFLPKLARKSLRERGIEERSIMRRQDGEAFDALVAVRMLQDGNQQPVGFLLLVDDITERVRLERRSEEAEQRYRRLLDALGDGVSIIRSGRVLFANPRFAEILGVKEADIVGLELRDHIATRDLLIVEETLVRIESESKGSQSLRCNLVAGSDRRELSTRMDLRAVDYGGAPAVLLLVHDETLERRARQELHRNEARLDALLEATADGVVVLIQSPVGPRVQMTNRAFLERFGLVAGQVLGETGSSLATVLRGRGQPAVADQLLDLADKPREGRWDLDGGEGYDLRLNAATLRGRRGQEFGWVLVFHDVGERKQAERRLERQVEEAELARVELQNACRRLDSVNKELEDRAGRLDHVNDELRSLDAMKSNLLGNVSHELQTPLVAIRGFTEMILKERLGTINEEQRKGLRLSLDNIDRLIGMIDGLLSFARSESDDGRLTLTRFDLADVMSSAVALMTERAKARSIRIDTSMDSGRFELCADRNRIQQVFINLLSNAIKFSEPGGDVGIRARGSDDRYVRIEIEDSGIGIAREDIARIFDRHFRAQPEAGESREGNGIGLAIVQDILRSHGCRIHVDSEPGRGTKVVFTLPLAGTVTEPIQQPEDEVENVDQAEVVEDPPIEATGQGQPRFRVIRRSAGRSDEDGSSG